MIIEFNDAKYIVKESFRLTTSDSSIEFLEGELINVVRVYPNLLRVGDKRSAFYLDESLHNDLMKKLSEVEPQLFEDVAEFMAKDKVLTLESFEEVTDDTSSFSSKLDVITVESLDDGI